MIKVKPTAKRTRPRLLECCLRNVGGGGSGAQAGGVPGDFLGFEPVKTYGRPPSCVSPT
jgi:hypothetical protein